jgi:hypothetical protein
MNERKQVSALERLRSLPDVFRGSDLTVRFGWTSKTASQTLYQWKQRDLVGALGGHSDVFVNLMANPHPQWEKAMRLAMPTAVIVGLEALRQAGWSTQVPHRPSVAVSREQSVFTVNPYEVEPRAPAWFQTAAAGIVKNPAGGLPILKPAWALADLLRQHAWGDFGLWPDDIEWSEVSPQDENDWDKACRAFGLEESPLLDLQVDSRGAVAQPGPGPGQI